MSSSFGEFLRKLREQKGLSLNQLAAKSGVSNAQISRIENGLRDTPRPDTIKKLAEGLNISQTELMEKAGYFEGFEDTKKAAVLNYFSTHEEIDKTLQNLISRFDHNNFHDVGSNVLETYFTKEDLEDFATDMGKTPVESKESFKEFIEYMGATTELKKNIAHALENELGTINHFKSDSELELVRIPIYGEIRAGYGSLAQEDIIGYEVTSRDAVKDAEYFYLIVKGDSMIEEGIYEGMRVLVRKQNHCENGKIGVVIVDGEEGTLKRVYYEDDTIVLRASNRRIPPRHYPIEEVLIQGQVTKVEFDV
ncbi:SOS-response transcriptional repressor LexA [Paenibacillus rhizosphaerae]|uniref:SOS-response transcriptional repressor LexA n=1 Tax=Paenibacillus rhizosphaerae TaxID=297318 RepID=A0A839U074_9BACL|nr:LexA family transcriptional regulator [Paenibacillus rhizosphaerae]MBB3132153.1 SOS-response transcriptional repressor LexA [Paenibacillus rhizosphaerae]